MNQTLPSNGKPKRVITEFWLRAVRFYTFNTPIAKGKYRAFLVALKLVSTRPDNLLVLTHDGRQMSADLSTGMQDSLFFLGEYEKAITQIVEKLVKQNNCKTFLDVGANFGWYTTLFAKYAGNDGEVHSFEPVPTIFDNLTRNYELMESPPNVLINNLALGETATELTINLFQGLSTGHASLSTQGRDDAIPFMCKVITLDSYLELNNVGDVDFLKVDIEGSELSFLKGAERLFQQKRPPIILMEMALNQTKNFGYLPNDLIKFISSRSDYSFFKIDEESVTMTEINEFAANDIGANVICIPQ